MRTVAAVALLEAWLHICRECSTLLPNALARTVTMPVEDGFVTVEIDGQEVELLLDTGFYGMSVMDGKWYKRKYGRVSAILCPAKRSVRS
ncbi:hypothetical protein FOZ62_019089, partial [Perkinsus olseni]